MNGPAWNHRHLEANGIGIHYVRHGAGPPLVVLHGWPEFWYTWRKNLLVLAREFDVVAPDLRRHGQAGSARPSEEPSGQSRGGFAYPRGFPELPSSRMTRGPTETSKRPG